MPKLVLVRGHLRRLHPYILARAINTGDKVDRTIPTDFTDSLGVPEVGSSRPQVDRYGNVVTASVNLGSWQSPSGFDANNRMTPNGGSTGWHYDVAGNLDRDSLNGTYRYDAEGRQVAYCPGVTDPANCTVQSATTVYAYDGEGRRVLKTEGAVVTTYVYDAQGQLAAEYGSAASGLACVTCYMMGDSLGSTRVVTNEQGAAVECDDYLPFGAEIPTGTERTGCYTASGVKQKFTGKERDNETGLDYFGYRYFSGAQGRFTSVDPDNAGASASDPQSWNAYAYVRNNPLSFIDPFGESCIKTDDGKPADDGDGKGCKPAGVKPDKGGKAGEIDPQVVNVGVGGDEARLIMLGRVGDSFSAHGVATVVSGGIQGAVAVDSGRGMLSLGWDLVRGLMGLRAAGVAVGVGGGRRIGSMVVLRTLKRGESIADLIEEAKTIGYEMQTEVAVVKLANGERALVTGGAEGISFGEGSIVRLYGHTHPFPTGPSSLDFQAIQSLGQRSSWIYEAGGVTKFTVK
jgi:RHS repeat-associated protein